MITEIKAPKFLPPSISYVYAPPAPLTIGKRQEDKQSKKIALKEFDILKDINVF